MTVVAKNPNVKLVERPMPGAPGRRRSWQRWNMRAGVIMFVVGIGALWLAVSLLMVLEVQ